MRDFLGLLAVPTSMRSDDEPRSCRCLRILRRRLDLEDVEGDPGEAAALELSQQGAGVHEPRSRHVDEVGAVREERELTRADEPARLGHQRRMDRDRGRGAEQVVQCRRAYAVACQRHARISSFGKTSAPSLAAGSTPYVSGLSPSGRLIPAAGAKPAFYGAPLVAWEPALGADEYQVQWSRTRYPWNPTDPATGKPRQKLTYGTSIMLPLTPGTWYYRVRGIDFFLPGTARAMSWSQTVAVVIAKPKFRVVPSR